MVRRRVASEKRRMAVGLRQCIRPSVESVTPGHDGYPLAFVLINWTAWKRPFPISGFESVGETHCDLYFPPADLAGTFSLNRILGCDRQNGSSIALVLTYGRPSHANQFVGQSDDDNILVRSRQ